MKAFITDHPAAFLVSAVFGVSAIAGMGALALAAGAALVPTFAIQLGAYALVVLAVASFVPGPAGAASSLALATGLPFLGFFAWLEIRIPPAAAPALVIFGIAGILLTVLASRVRRNGLTPLEPLRRQEPRLG